MTAASPRTLYNLYLAFACAAHVAASTLVRVDPNSEDAVGLPHYTSVGFLADALDELDDQFSRISEAWIAVRDNEDWTESNFIRLAKMAEARATELSPLAHA